MVSSKDPIESDYGHFTSLGFTLRRYGKSACVTTHAISERYEMATTIHWKSSLCCRMDFRGLDNYTVELHRMALAACYDDGIMY